MLLQPLNFLLQIARRHKKDEDTWDDFIRAILRKTRKQFTDQGYNLIEHRVLDRIWELGKCIQRPPMKKESRNILPLALRHAGAEWRMIRESNNKAFNRDVNEKTLEGGKRRRVGGVSRQWDSLFDAWAGKRWYEEVMDEDAKEGFMREAYRVAKKPVPEYVMKAQGKTRDRDGRVEGRQQPPKSEEERLQDEEKKRKVMMEQESTWDLTDNHATRASFAGDSMLIVNWINGVWSVNQESYRNRIARIHNDLEEAYRDGLKPAGRGADYTRHVFREFNEKADHLTRIARQGNEGTQWEEPGLQTIGKICRGRSGKSGSHALHTLPPPRQGFLCLCVFF